MNTDFVILALSLLQLFIGWLIAYLHYRRKLIKLKVEFRNTNTAEVLEARDHWYKYGVEDTLNDPMLIREKCNEYFHTHFI